MALPDDMEIVKVILPKAYVTKIDALIAPGQRSRSAVVRRMVERSLGIDFLLPIRSENGSASASKDQEAA